MKFFDNDNELSLGGYVLLALVLVPVALAMHFTVGFIPALILQYAWNAGIATWLPLPAATIWNTFVLMAFITYFMPIPSNKDVNWKAQLVGSAIFKRLFILAVIIIAT